MTHFYIFSDASFDPKTGKGVTATLTLNESDWDRRNEKPAYKIQTKIIDSENISRLEFISAISALNEWKINFRQQDIPSKITLVIDCKAIENLLQRRSRLEKNKFQSLRTSQLLSNADLYKEFLHLYDELQLSILWVKGHSPKGMQSEYQQVFSMVDKVARQKLREIR